MLVVLWLVVCLASFVQSGSTNAIQLLHTVPKGSTVKYVLNPNALDILAELDGPLHIISAIGRSRNGKSTTLNQLIQRMTGSQITPFGTSDSADACTYGIWMFVISPQECLVNNDQSTNSNLTYLFLDIEGSDTETEDEAVRYASIVTLLSSQTYLFVQSRLFASNIEHIGHIQNVISHLQGEKIDISMSDLNLGVIIRRPLKPGHVTLEEKIHQQFRELTRGHTQQQRSADFGRFTTVKAIPEVLGDLRSDSGYATAIEEIFQHILSGERSRRSRLKISKNATVVSDVLRDVVYQMNENRNMSAICFQCTFSRTVAWLPYGPFTGCSKKCGGGEKKRYRECNTGDAEHCVKYVGGDPVDTHACNMFKCEWLPFPDKWESCSRQCNGGTQVRRRGCSTGNVTDCIEMFGGEESESRDCNERPCKYAATGDSQYDECSKPCGGGKSRRELFCETGNVQDCLSSSNPGPNFETKQCNTRKCLWEAIGEWSACSKRCGMYGEEKRSRRCETGNDNDCEGVNYEKKPCNRRPCEWKRKGSQTPQCSNRCGKGTRKIQLVCETGYDGDCYGENTKIEDCNGDSGCGGGGGGGGGFCFASDSWVIEYPNNKKLIDDVRVFDKLLSYDDKTDEFVFSPVILLNHFKSYDGGDMDAPMITLVVQNEHNGWNVTLSHNHLIYIRRSSFSKSPKLIPARTVVIGDAVVDSYNQSSLVVDILQTVAKPRTVITEEGTLVVNGVAASAFAGSSAFNHVVLRQVVRSFYWLFATFYPPVITNYAVTSRMIKVIYYGGIRWILVYFATLETALCVLSGCFVSYYFLVRRKKSQSQ